MYKNVYISRCSHVYILLKPNFELSVFQDCCSSKMAVIIFWALHAATTGSLGVGDFIRLLWLREVASVSGHKASSLPTPCIPTTFPTLECQLPTSPHSSTHLSIAWWSGRPPSFGTPALHWHKHSASWYWASTGACYLALFHVCNTHYW